MGKRKYTEEMLLSESLKYNRIKDFQNSNWNMYRATIRRGKEFSDKAFEHMTGGNIKWNHGMIENEALQCSSRSEWQKRFPKSYDNAWKRGQLKKYCKHMEYIFNFREKLHCVYLIELINKEDSRYYYVGQTHDMKQRMDLHTRKSGGSPVYSHLQTPEWNRMKLRILWKDLSYEDSLKLEQNTIDKFIKNNMNLLNIMGGRKCLALSQ